MMLEREVVVALEEGLHARPAARMAQLAKSFQSSVEILRGTQSANAKSTVKIMLLAVKQGERIRIRADGEDAAAAMAELVAAVSGSLDAPTPGMQASVPDRGGDGRIIRGLCGNEGVAIAPPFLYFPDQSAPPRRRLAPAEIEGEIRRFRAAVLELVGSLGTACDAARDASGGETEQSNLFGAIRELAEDVELLGPIEQQIGLGQDAASCAFAVGHDLAEHLARVDDAYFRLRADDLRGVTRQLVDILLGRRNLDLASLREPAILVAGDLSALDFQRLPVHLVRGLLTTAGGPTSHIAILARSLGFPAVVGASASAAELGGAALVALDGTAGCAILDPDPATQEAFQGRALEARRLASELRHFTHLEPLTRNGVAIEVAANIGSAAEIETALRSGAMGVGLFRTEFMFMHRGALPSEEEQARIYGRVLAAFAPRPVLIRTLDIGGDKPLPGLRSEPESNPFLGWRGIRMCLDRPELFDPQLRALLRAAVHGRLRVMFPMISDVSEVVVAKARLEACRTSLRSEGQPTGAIELGIMIETPAAALCARDLARHVDFFSIGTNDLTQYTMAADRTNARLARLSRADHPAVLRMIALACEGAREAGIWVGVCGEAAADPALIPRLLSWGVTELSMSPSMIPRAKKAVMASGG